MEKCITSHHVANIIKILVFRSTLKNIKNCIETANETKHSYYGNIKINDIAPFFFLQTTNRMLYFHLKHCLLFMSLSQSLYTPFV